MKLPLVTGAAVHQVDLGAAGPDGVNGLGVQENAGVGRLPGPAPLEVELVVGEGPVGDHIAEGLAGDGDDAVLHAEDVLGGGGAVGLDVEGPAGQVLAIEEFRFAFPAGEEAEKAQDQQGCQVPFHGMIELVILTKVRIFLLNSQLAGYLRPPPSGGVRGRLVRGDVCVVKPRTGPSRGTRGWERAGRGCNSASCSP